MSSAHQLVATKDIVLTSQELKVLQTLKTVVAEEKLDTVVRVAGGWVRDKLLGRENHDLDITLDDMTGSQFARMVHQHLTSTGQEASTVAVIQANPERSKHLETATTKVHGKELDFVNLRCEEYTSESRIPTMSFGTPLEDALRRDFTINSMFYNVNDEVIEDYTGQGYIDLQSGLLRTPLEPLTTLLDDPLRALRAVRFASRYAFDLAPDLLHCMACDEVQAALISKVSRERVGRELEGMLGSARPIGALRMLHQLQLLPLVLPLPQFASKQEVQAVVDSGGDGKRQGKASTAMAAMERFPYAPGAPEGALVDCHGTAAFDQGMQVVNALEQVFHALVGGGTSLAAACLPSAAQAPAAGAGGAGGAPEPSGGTKRPANVSLDSSAEMHPRVRVVVPATDGGKEVQCCNPYAEREDTSTQSPAEKAAVRRAQQLQTARDSSGLSADVRGDDMMSACLACALWAVRGHLVIPPAPKKRQPKPVWGVLAVLREGLKSGNKQADAVKAAQDCAEALLPLLQRHAEYTDADRLALGLAIREAGPLWMPALHVAVAIHALSLSGGVVAADTPQSIDEGTVSTALEAGSRLAQFAHSSGLWQAWAMKPLLSGKELMKLGAPGGSGIAQYIDAMLHWQLLHPSASVEEALVMAQGLIQEKAAGEAAE